MKVDRRDIEKNLPGKGFHRVDDKDHIYFYHQVGGKETGAYTKVSHSRKFRDIGGDILTAIRKQLRLDKNIEAVRLINCPMKGDEYKGILRAKGFLQERDSD